MKGLLAVVIEPVHYETHDYTDELGKVEKIAEIRVKLHGICTGYQISKEGVVFDFINHVFICSIDSPCSCGHFPFLLSETRPFLKHQWPFERFFGTHSRSFPKDSLNKKTSR